MIPRPRYVALAGEDRPALRARTVIRPVVRQLVGRYAPVLWVSSSVGAIAQVVIDEFLALDQKVRVVVPAAPSFLARPGPPIGRRTLVDQVALAQPVRIPRHVAAAQVARQLAEVADLLVVLWSGDVQASEVVAPILEATFREVPTIWVPLPWR